MTETTTQLALFISKGRVTGDCKTRRGWLLLRCCLGWEICCESWIDVFPAIATPASNEVDAPQ